VSVKEVYNENDPTAYNKQVGSSSITTKALPTGLSENASWHVST
jgi:hypothetical protein